MLCPPKATRSGALKSHSSGFPGVLIIAREPGEKGPLRLAWELRRVLASWQFRCGGSSAGFSPGS